MSLFNSTELDSKFATIQPLVRQIHYDSLTPILAYTALGGAGATLMESAYDEGYGKYSFIGVNQLATLRAIGKEIKIEFGLDVGVHHNCDPYSLLPEFCEGRKVFGFVTYDGVRVKEKLPDRHPPKNVPDFFFRIYKTVICFNHQSQQVIISHEGS